MQKDFNEFRRISEVAIVGLACERATEEDLRTLEGILKDLEAAPGDYMNDVRFHDALAVASHNMMLAATIHLVTSMIAEIRIRFFGRPDYQRRSMDSHTAIYEAVRDRDVQRAKREMELHLEIVEEFAQKYPKEV